MRPDPKIIKNLLDPENYAVLVKYLSSKDKKL